MFENFTKSFVIVKKSFDVLMSEKKLLFFPLISGIFLIALLLSFIAPIFVFNSDAPLILFSAIFYFLSYFVIIFFNTSLVHAVNNKIEGKPVSLMESISFSFTRILNIIGWAAIAATVGMILSFLRGEANKQRGIGGLIASLVVNAIGMVWSLATFFVIPVIVFENVNPITAIQRSVELIKKGWGQAVTAGFGIGVVFFILYLIGIGAIMLSAFTGILFLPVLVIGIVYLVAVFLVESTLQSIFVVELYKYVNTGNAVLFNPDELQGAFKPKNTV
ncbi:MAG: DUF6159 family protein [Candidatus Micrarchaeota archaeon]